MSASPRTPKLSELMRQPNLLLAFGFGSGLSPKAPGTLGTLVGALLFIPLVLYVPWLAWLVFMVGLFAGSWICGRASDYLQVHDHGGIVWDEFVGIWLVLLLLPSQDLLNFVLAFVAFRFFDVIKPWPIGWADRKVEGGFGIMLDDVLAALMAVVVIWGLWFLLN